MAKIPRPCSVFRLWIVARGLHRLDGGYSWPLSVSEPRGDTNLGEASEVALGTRSKRAGDGRYWAFTFRSSDAPWQWPPQEDRRQRANSERGEDHSTGAHSSAPLRVS